MKITFKDENCKYTGVWQENEEDAVVSYSKIAFFEIGFAGETLVLDATPVTRVAYFLDGEEVQPIKQGNTLVFTAANGKHTLKIKIYNNERFAVRMLEADGFFRVPDKRYIHFIGDSITHAYPGFSSVTPEKMGADYSVVAHCGMSLVDGWGWYAPPVGMKVRMGMESRYFVLQLPGDNEQPIPYVFNYCRVPDDIVVFLGTNDYLDNEANREDGNVQTFVQHYLAFVKRLREHFPTARVHIMKPLSDKCCRHEGITAAYERIVSELSDIYLIPADTWGVEISPDGTHPSENGYVRLVEGMIGYFNER